MGAGGTLNFWALVLLILPGVLDGQWAVWYLEERVCAVRGSTVVLQCTYDYPEEDGQVKETMWCLNHADCIDTTYVCHSKNERIDPGYKDRAECLGDKQKNCTLKVKNIKHTDAGQYRFRFITEKNKWTGQNGVTLTITELRVSMISSSKNGTIREGDLVLLTCAAKGCSPNQLFIWFKNKQPFQQTNSTLHFKSVSCRDEGNYSCALKGEGYRSEELQLDIQASSCPPDPETSNSSLISIIVGTLLAVLAVALVLLIFFKRKRTPEEDDRERKTQAAQCRSLLLEQNRAGSKESENCEISGVNTRPVTTGLKEEGTSEEEEVHYASVRLEEKKPPEQPPGSGHQSHDDGVIYSSLAQ